MTYLEAHRHVVTNRARIHVVLNSSPTENAHLTMFIYTKARRAAGRDSNVGLPPTKLLLRLAEQLLVQHIVYVEATFHSQALINRAVQV